MSDADHPLDVLAFSPHPDDAELCCGGTLALLAAQGYRVGIVDLTRGELASNGTPETRAAEAAEASRVLGLAHRENLDLPDGFLDPGAGYEDAPESAGANTQVACLVEALRRLRPELVLAPYRHARHPDHEATSELVRRAVFFAGVRRFATDTPGERFVPRQVLYYQMRVGFDPSVVVDTTAWAETKARAVACYGSQVDRGGAAAATLANAPLSLAALDARDRAAGAMIGVSHGEPFLIDGPVPLADPVAHFRAAGAEALLFPGRK